VQVTGFDHCHRAPVRPVFPLDQTCLAHQEAAETPTTCSASSRRAAGHAVLEPTGLADCNGIPAGSGTLAQPAGSYIPGGVISGNGVPWLVATFSPTHGSRFPSIRPPAASTAGSVRIPSCSRQMLPRRAAVGGAHDEAQHRTCLAVLPGEVFKRTRVCIGRGSALDPPDLWRSTAVAERGEPTVIQERHGA
jgi:hypothetical protein